MQKKDRTTGKMYPSAFDVADFKLKKMLFLVHRKRILIQEREIDTQIDTQMPPPTPQRRTI